MPAAGEVDPLVWRACAGGAVQIPPVGARVYYFPEGHAEQASSDPDLTPLAPLLLPRGGRPRPYFPCWVACVRYLADRDSDEVYARIKLVPESCETKHLPPQQPHPPPSPLPSFSKVLTASDANNGGGFSVPRFCAETVFPKLDYDADPPLQNVSFKDVHGATWDFRHIYRGTPRRHLLTTGWSKFVNAKKLIAGDSVVFIQKKKEPVELCIGIQRVVKQQPAPNVDYSRYGIMSPKGGSNRNSNTGLTEGRDDHQHHHSPRGPIEGGGRGFSRTWRGRVPPENVVDAVRAAEEGMPFEVMHYPKPGTPEFVVRADLVDAARGGYWSTGVRVKMAVEADEPSAAAARTAWHQGIITSTGIREAHGPWPPSMWRMLQVSWDEPDLLHAKNISPWQVEIASAAPQVPPPYPSAKRFKPISSDLLTSTEDSMLFPIPGFPDAVAGCVNPTVFGYNTFPAGMQGARQDTTNVSTFSTFGGGSSQVLLDNSLSIVPPQNLNSVSTELNFLSSSHSESSSPPSRNSVLSLDKDHYNNKIANSVKAKNSSFQLFGVSISLGQPADSFAAEDTVANVADESATQDSP